MSEVGDWVSEVEGRECEVEDDEGKFEFGLIGLPFGCGDESRCRIAHKIYNFTKINKYQCHRVIIIITIDIW